MSVEITNEYGHVTISKEVISTVAGGAATECYGIVGMASKNQFRDGLSEILGKENFSRGVVVTNDEGDLTIDMYIIVSYGVHHCQPWHQSIRGGSQRTKSSKLCAEPNEWRKR